MADPALIVAVADGEEETRSLMKRLMESEGYLALEAGDTDAARRLAMEYPWDVMLLDSELAGGEEMPLCREIKLNPALGNRYVIVISSEVDSAHKIRAFEAGADDYMAKPIESVELRARVRAWRRINELQKQLVLTNARLEQLALVDPLTQVYNRRFFQQELTRAVDQARRHARPLAVAMVDIDHFKQFNDTYGHTAGDRILEDVSTILTQFTRSADTVSRYGGEEFALILPDTDFERASVLAERIRATIAAANFDVGARASDIHVTVSIGLASLTDSMNEVFELVDRADQALYVAKSAGRNCVRMAAAEPTRASS